MTQDLPPCRDIEKDRRVVADALRYAQDNMSDFLDKTVPPSLREYAVLHLDRLWELHR
jgi:hypothetical protein